MTLKLYKVAEKEHPAAEETIAAETPEEALKTWEEWTGEDPEWYDLEATEIPGDKVIGIWYEDDLLDVDPLPIPPEAAKAETNEDEGKALYVATAAQWAKQAEGLDPINRYIASTEW